MNIYGFNVLKWGGTTRKFRPDFTLTYATFQTKDLLEDFYGVQPREGLSLCVHLSII